MVLFDHVIESAKIGLRKPDPRIYQMMVEALDVDPKNCVYLDDLGVNLKPAREMGMTTIKVTNASQAIDELEAATGCHFDSRRRLVAAPLLLLRRLAFRGRFECPAMCRPISAARPRVLRGIRRPRTPRLHLDHSSYVRTALSNAGIKYKQIEVDSYSLKIKPFKPLRRF